MLVDLFCRTVAVDMRGYGESDKPCGIWEYKLDKLVDDVNQLITELGLFFFGFSQLNKITLWAEQDKFIFQYQQVFCSLTFVMSASHKQIYAIVSCLPR